MALFGTFRKRGTLLRNFLYDWRRFSGNSFVFKARTRENRRAMIHILAHSLEHGMALSEPREGYGQQKANSLIGKVETYLADYGPDASTDWALAVLGTYCGFHADRAHALPELERRLEKLNSAQSAAGTKGGVFELTKEQIAAATQIDYERFVQARHSVRQYADRPVSSGLIERAVRNAQCAPSVCNRQTCRVYALTDKKAIAEALAYQSGNAGFGHELGALFVITANMEHLNLVGERYQGWIDGGIFAMSLLLALHAEGLGTCCLNWSTEMERDQALRRHLAIPDEELVITMMGAGHLKDRFSVPVSKRKPLDSVLVMKHPGP